MHILKTPSRNRIYSSLFLLLVILIAVNTSISAQVDAEFSADTTHGCGELTVQFTNEGYSTGADYDFYWYFEPGEESTLENPSHTFSNDGQYLVKFVVTNNTTFEKDSSDQLISVYDPYVNITGVDTTNSCINGIIQFRSSTILSVSADSIIWDFDDDTYQKLDYPINYIYHNFAANGSYNVKYSVYEDICHVSDSQLININGPHANITITPEQACEGQSLEFNFDDIGGDIIDYTWDFRDGSTSTDKPANHTYNDTTGQIIIKLDLDNGTKTCEIQDTLNIHDVDAIFNLPDKRCHLDTFRINESSVGANQFIWKLDGTTYSLLQTPPAFVLNSGNHTLGLKVIHQDGCADSTNQTFTVNELPSITLSSNVAICPGESTKLEVEGGDLALWSPGVTLDDSTSLTPNAQPDSSTVYTVTLTNSTTGCSNIDSTRVFVQPGFLNGYISVGIYDSVLIDSKLVIGDSVQVWLIDSLNRILSYTWEPDYMISCTNCPTPSLQPLENTEYTLAVTDTNQCNDSETFTIPIQVRKEYHIGIQAAFTPNGDGINDIMSVDGWGIKTLLEFKVFNRNGNQIFESSDVQSGWDGNYNNHLQPAGAYMYLIKAEMWDGSIKTTNGTFSLIR